MKKRIFYSWQSDLPNKTNRGFIQDALKKAASELKNDKTISVEPVIDRDTQDVPGSPDIAATIFSKIINADVFVADVSIINSDSKRPSPNPNVLLELGYALKALGENKTILIMNKAFGEAELLPFDLKMKQITGYNLPEAQKSKAEERKYLQKLLQANIRAIISVSDGKFFNKDEPEDNPIELATKYADELNKKKIKTQFLESKEGVLAAEEELKHLH